MRNMQRESECIASLGSMTQTLRAQKALAAAGIRSDVIHADAEVARRGCAYALSFPCYQKQNVQTVIKELGLRARYVGGR